MPGRRTRALMWKFFRARRLRSATNLSGVQLQLPFSLGNSQLGRGGGGGEKNQPCIKIPTQWASDATGQRRLCLVTKPNLNGPLHLEISRNPCCLRADYRAEFTAVNSQIRPSSREADAPNPPLALSFSLGAWLGLLLLISIPGSSFPSCGAFCRIRLRQHGDHRDVVLPLKV